MPFLLLSKMAKSKITYIRNTISSSMQKCTTIMPVISHLLNNNRLIVPTICKREDYKMSKHDAVFSPWQILIGSNDWEDFKNGKDGVGRYRVQNLPRKSCTGIYELGVAVIGQDQCRKLDLDNVLPAYVGHSVNVISRIQHYGRCGGHFPPGLFEDIFSKGGAIVYRWVPMGFKREAEAEEGKILRKSDYPWNKCSNGERRHLDLLKKFDDREFMSKRKSGILQVLFPFLPNQFCIRIKEERKVSCDVDGEKSNHFFTSMLKLIWSIPQLVSDRFDDSCSDSVCGIILENGGCCNRSPVKGRKRCVEHKWQRVCRVSPEKHRPSQPEIFTRQDHNHKDSDVTCGVILPDMETCNKRPVPGRKRCEDHKGMKINAFLFLEKTVKDEKSDTEIIEEEGSTRFCEATTKNGLPCTRRSPKGSKSCWQHKEKTSGDT